MDQLKQAAITDWINQELDAAYDEIVASKAMSTDDALNISFYSRTPTCYLCGQPVDRDQAAPFRTPQGDVVCDKTCLMRVQSGVWELLEAEGEGNPGHFEDDSRSHDDLLPDKGSDQIRPYLVAPIDETTPMAALGPVHRDRPQQVHNPR